MRRGSRTIAERAALLGGGLLLVLAGCSNEVGAAAGQAGDEALPEASEEASGFLRPVERPAEGEAPETAEGATSAAEAAAGQQPQPEPPLPAQAAQAQAPESPQAPQAPAPGEAYDDAADVELAAALLHEGQERFNQLVDGRRERLAGPRVALLLAFAAARAGELEQARELAQGLEGEERIRASEHSLLGRALNPGQARAVPAALAAGTPLERALEMALLEREAALHAGRGEHAGAARALSQLLLAELASPWAADRRVLARWSEELQVAQERYRWSPRGDWAAIEVTVQPGDHLIGIRKRVLAEHPELLLCTGLIAKANGLASEESIQPEDVLRIPTDRASALVDVSARWAFYLLGDEVVAAWEIGVGKEEGSTRTGTYEVTLKQREPMWFQPGKDPVPFGAPENPLGTRWLEWGEDGRGTHLGFHGTSDPAGVGGRVSKGCVRMRNEDVELLYDVLPLGATVVVQP